MLLSQGHAAVDPLSLSSRRLLFSLAMLSVLAAGCSDDQAKTTSSQAHLIEARHSLAAGDTAKAKEALDASIQEEPNLWALLERAKLLAQSGDDEAARSDCQAALELAPENKDVQWLLAEIKKPAAQRFKGSSEPPSRSK